MKKKTLEKEETEEIVIQEAENKGNDKKENVKESKDNKTKGKKKSQKADKKEEIEKADKKEKIENIDKKEEIEKTDKKDRLDKKQKNKKIPKGVSQEIMKKVLRNLFSAIGIILYFFVLNLAYTKMQQDRLIEDIKVFAGAFLVAGIFMLERAYKKDSGKMVITAIELIALSIHSLTIMHVITLFKYDFRLYLLTSSYIISIYFVFKAIVIYTKGRREYWRSLSDISKIVKEDEPVIKEATKKLDKDEKKHDKDEKKEIENKKIKETKTKTKSKTTEKKAVEKKTTKKEKVETKPKQENVTKQKTTRKKTTKKEVSKDD